MTPPPGQMISVIRYSAVAHGDEASITATVDISNSGPTAVFARLVLGGISSLDTSLVHNTVDGSRWTLTASAPLSLSRGARLFVEVISQGGELLDRGECGLLVPVSRPALNISTSSSSGSSVLRGARTRPRNITPYARPTPSPTYDDFDQEYRPSSRDSRKKRHTSSARARRAISPGLGDIRSQEHLTPPESTTSPVLPQTWTPLAFSNSLTEMNEAWDAHELQAGRRLVHFTRVFDGTSLTVRCRPFSQQDYDTEQSLGLRQPTDRDIISCIYRADKGAYCVTSVDLIRLLEFLIGVEFEVDEKNRIRR